MLGQHVSGIQLNGHQVALVSSSGGTKQSEVWAVGNCWMKKALLDWGNLIIHVNRHIDDLAPLLWASNSISVGSPLHSFQQAHPNCELVKMLFLGFTAFLAENSQKQGQKGRFSQLKHPVHQLAKCVRRCRPTAENNRQDAAESSPRGSRAPRLGNLKQSTKPSHRKINPKKTCSLFAGVWPFGGPLPAS